MGDMRSSRVGGGPDVPRVRRMPEATRRADRAAWVGLSSALLLVALAMAVPAVAGWDVHVRSFPPLHAAWDPRVGPGTPAALALAALAVWQAGSLASRLRWSHLLVT